MDYIKRLKELRVKNGYTQEQIAEKLNMKREQYQRYESGKMRGDPESHPAEHTLRGDTESHPAEHTLRGDPE